MGTKIIFYPQHNKFTIRYGLKRFIYTVSSFCINLEWLMYYVSGLFLYWIDEDADACKSDRVKKLAAFQTKALLHALSCKLLQWNFQADLFSLFYYSFLVLDILLL